ncbi:MAG: hypothetical protein COX07_03930 [Bacteroidetes bacterium CG23_combo_of_CG06-09_8_20_14_all_32_9]|nr:MAG: hypothetical protein COX07_03930 [Bacteroidetes bacterium CG23_combo_of_CG06-09_8_20_14_all_32_9]
MPEGQGEECNGKPLRGQVIQCPNRKEDFAELRNEIIGDELFISHHRIFTGEQFKIINGLYA